MVQRWRLPTTLTPMLLTSLCEVSMILILQDNSEVWMTDLLNNHHEEARKRAYLLLDEGTATDQGCIVTGTTARRKVRFHGRQAAAYRFVFCVLSGTVASFDDVVRHKCHNPLCINPEHLVLGTRAENQQDDWEAAAYGVDFDLI